MNFFRRRSPGDHVDEAEARVAELRLTLLVAMAAIDDRMALSELDLLNQAIERLGMSHAHRDVLADQLLDLLDDPPNVARAAGLVGDHALTGEQAQTITHELMCMALSDGVVHPSEQDLLRAVQDAISCAPQRVPA